MPRSVTSPIFIQCSLQRLTALFFLFPAVSRSFLRLELFGANLDEAMRPTNSAKGCLARIKAAVDLFCWIHDVADDVRPRQSTARRWDGALVNAPPPWLNLDQMCRSV